MALNPDLFTALYKPDVLMCLADLSNDEVFTPPDVANQILDMLPQELFRDPNTKFLDPAVKSGVFLREIAKRLIAGLADKIPNLQERCDWIFKNQLYGIAITELTSLLGRRSVYCSKYPNSPFSISKFDDVQGNIIFHKIRHRWNHAGVNGKCIFCGTSYDGDLGDMNREGLETHAYEFIHTLHPEEIFDMKFDVIISNPPYQLSTGQGQSQASPLYHRFIEQAIKLNPHYISMIVPSRWFTGGMGLGAFRNKMLNDHRLEAIVDFSLSEDCFPGVDIAGGVNYFLWNRQHEGDCVYTYIDNGKKTVLTRKLNEFDVLVRDNRALQIVRKIKAFNETSISSIMSSLGPFGLSTAERGVPHDNGKMYKLMSSAGMSYIPRTEIKTGTEYIDQWKVVIGKATSAGAAKANKSDGTRKVIATLEVLEPNSVCTFSYFIGGSFKRKSEAINCRNYIATKFVRFLLLQNLGAININKDKFQFVPIQDFTKAWTDKELYEKYNLTNDEIALVESMIKPMDLAGGDTDA